MYVHAPDLRAPGRIRSCGLRFRNALEVIDCRFYQRHCGPQMQRLVLLMRGSTAVRGTFRGIPNITWCLSSAGPDTCLASLSAEREMSDAYGSGGEDDERSCIER
jgi:hypothetical protein